MAITLDEDTSGDELPAQRQDSSSILVVKPKILKRALICTHPILFFALIFIWAFASVLLGHAVSEIEIIETYMYRKTTTKDSFECIVLRCDPVLGKVHSKFVSASTRSNLRDHALSWHSKELQAIRLKLSQGSALEDLHACISESNAAVEATAAIEI
jgi:hypothetical protein